MSVPESAKWVKCDGDNLLHSLFLSASSNSACTDFKCCVKLVGVKRLVKLLEKCYYYTFRKEISFKSV